jgi:hypothetical protein
MGMLRALALLAVLAPPVVALVVAACSTSSSSSSSGPPPSGTDDAASEAQIPAVDAGSPFVPGTPSTFFRGCSPTGAADCPDAFLCFTGHTSPIDVYGECTVECTGNNAALCTVNGGTCVCPVTAAGLPGNCTDGNDAGAVTVCAPLDDAGPLPAANGDAAAANDG